jgi:hypothetical protein
MHQASSLELLREFETDERLFIAIDKQGFVSQEYSNNINATMFAAQWLKKFFGKIVNVTTSPLERGLRVKLDELHFSSKDRRFVQVAIASSSKIIVTRDPDYSSEIIRELRQRCSIEVCSAKQALVCIRGLPKEALAAQTEDSKQNL